MTNQKIVSVPLLAAILAAGLLVLIPTSITNAQAQMYNDGYGDRYYADSYYEDDNRYGYDSHPKKSADVSVQELECVNSDVNVNGVDLTKIQDPTRWAAANNLIVNEADGPDGPNGNGVGDSINVDSNLVNICVNYNQNEQVIGPTDEEPPEPLTGNLAVSKFVTCDEFEGEGFTSVQQTEPDPCLELLNNITASDFGISMAGNEPVVPDTFPASDPPGQNVILGSGSYTVTETADASVAANVTALEEELSVDIEGPIPSFEGNCIQSLTNDFVATGIMAPEGSQTCEITNNFLWEERENLDLAVANTFANTGDDTVSILLGNGDGTFGTKTDFGAGNNPKPVTVGLFNGDSNLDLAVANLLDANVSIMLGNGDGTFGTKTDFKTGDVPVHVAVGHFNGDSNLDLAVANENDEFPVVESNVSILLGNGDGTFGTKTDFGVGKRPGSVAVGHFNGDSNLDLAVANSNDNDVSILLGNGDGTFGTKTDFGVGNFPIFVAVGLFDADSDLDLAVSLLNDGVSILLGNGDGTFGGANNFGGGFGAAEIAIGDFNGDSNLDLAVAIRDEDHVSILLGNGDGTFGTKTDFGAGDGPESVAVGLFNSDSILDLAVVNNLSDNVSILLGNGDGTFGTKTDFGVGNNPRSVAVGDFDNT